MKKPTDVSSDVGPKPEPPPRPPRSPRPGWSPAHGEVPPTFGPTAYPQVTIQGTGPLAPYLLAFQVDEAENTPASCRVLLQDPSFADSSLTSPGSEISFGAALTLTYSATESGGAPLFQGRVYGVGLESGPGTPPRVEIHAYDALQRLAMTRRSRSFHEISTSDAMRATAHDHGLGADVELTGPTQEVLVQANQTDLAFLQALAAEADAEFWMEGETFHARPRGYRSGESVTLAAGGTLQEVRVFADLSRQRRSLAIGGWDVRSKTAIAGLPEADSPGPGGPAPASGSRILEEVSLPGPGEWERIVHTSPETPEVAASRAQLRLHALRRGFVTAEGSTYGAVGIRVGRNVDLTGLGARFQGAYQVTATHHTWNTQEGYRTRFHASREEVGS